MYRFLTIILISISLAGCGVYSFTGATIAGKSLYMHPLENRARNVVPSLSPALTNKIRNRILSQTGLSPITSEKADYDITGTITGYEVTISGVQNTQQASQNRLTITVEITFKNRLDEKANFIQSFSRFNDFPGNQTLQSVETGLIEDIGDQLANDIFQKAFVNW
jgi:hypothetical protein